MGRCSGRNLWPERGSPADAAILSIVLVVTGFVAPVLLTWLGYLPYMSRVLDVIKPYVVYPSIFGTRHLRPLPYLLGNPPLVGHALYTAMFLVLNIVLTSVNYKSMQPHAWYADEWQEIVTYIFYRTGVLAFALAPLVLLLSSRNNILLWLTNWSHATFLTLHRWVARIFALQVLLHSVLALVLYKRIGTYEAMEKEDYWIWGAVATVAVVILAFGSGLYFRRRMYELFLISHIVLSVIVLVGCWYHIALIPHLDGWGYLLWMYAAFAVWGFDRAARIARMIKNGIRHPVVTDLTEGYARVDISRLDWGTDPGTHVYAYFPTLTPLRPWENHPFSVVPTVLLDAAPVSAARSHRTSGDTGGSDPESDGGHAEKNLGSRLQVSTMTPDINASRRVRTNGITLFVKKAKGATASLQANARLLTLLDGPYPNTPTREILRCDRLLLLGGGIGITSLIPWTLRHHNVRLCWTVKESARCLVAEMQHALSRVAERDVSIGSRMDLDKLVAEEEAVGWGRVGVVVCGPAGFCDDARAAVVAAGRRGLARFTLEVDAYAW